MKKVFSNPLFLAGLPLLVCGIAFGESDSSGYSAVAAGFFIPGLALVACGIAAARKQKD